MKVEKVTLVADGWKTLRIENSVNEKDRIDRNVYEAFGIEVNPGDRFVGRVTTHRPHRGVLVTIAKENIYTDCYSHVFTGRHRHQFVKDFICPLWILKLTGKRPVKGDKFYFTLTKVPA